MSAIVSIKDIAKHSGKVVTVRGWLYNKRSSGKIRFLELRDGSSKLLQLVVVQNVADEESFELSDKMGQESAFEASGLVKEHGRKKGTFELEVQHIKLISFAAENYPISLKEHGPEHLINHRHLWIRTPKQVCILKIRAKIIQSIRSFFDTRDFTLIDTPILTPSACEETSELFETDYFDGKAYLTQSGQLYAEAAAHALGKVYTFGPTFRAEKSKTRKHLTEFWMIEPELAFANMEDVMKLSESLVKNLLEDVIKSCKEELSVIERDISSLEKIIASKFPRITYKEALELLNKNSHKLSWGDDFGAKEETALGDLFKGLPVFIYNFPSESKAFYFKKDPKDASLALGFDLIAPESYGELIGGSERETELNTLMENIKKQKLNEKDYRWYIDLRKYGSTPHAGFGLGLERTVAWICGLPHVRESIPFPRMINHIYP